MGEMRRIFLLLTMINLSACSHRHAFQRSGRIGSTLSAGSSITIDVTKWRAPLQGPISSYYGPRRSSGLFRGGRYHHGIDIRAKAGTKIRAAASGRVIFAGWKRGFGRLVIVDHGRLHTYYAHSQSLNVRRGDWVDRGQWLARVGSSGRSTGPHLHFEIREESTGRTFDPIVIFKRQQAISNNLPFATIGKSP